MRKIHLTSISLLFLLGLYTLMISSCKEETETLNLDYGYDYFPTTINHWVEYEVDSIKYGSFFVGGIDTFSYEVREEIGEEFEDNEGRPAVSIQRFVRTDNSIPWTDINPTVWYMVRTEERAERMEGHLRFMKMTFPVTNNRKWFGNTYLNTNEPDLAIFSDWQYTYDEVGESRTINNLNFAETAKVVQNNYDDYVQKIYSEEVYAKGVGMVYKEEWMLRIGNNLQVPCCRCRCACIHAPVDCECNGQDLSTESSGRPNCAPSSNDGGCSEADKTAQCPWPDNAEVGSIAIIKIKDYKR